MTLDPSSTRWLARVDRDGGPIYIALVAALEQAVRAGELQPGDQLPPQRRVAQALGIDLTTVTRAYAAARAKGLVEGAVGRGTFISKRAGEDDAGLVDLSMNLPPPPLGVSLATLLRETSADILQRTDAASLMAYHPGAGALGQKTAAAAWLEPSLGPVPPDRLLIAAGAQAALAAALTTICRPGDGLVVEALTYPGLIAIAAQLGVRLIPCPCDGQGPLPEALDRICAEQRPTAVYIVPTMQNPCAGVMGLERRQAIAALAEARDLWIIEDDPYSRLMDAPPSALAILAPTRTIYAATLSKCFSPGLRLAFVVCPPGEMTERMALALRGVSLMPAPLMTAVVSAWIRGGEAEALLDGVRREARARRALAAEALPSAVGEATSLHVWLPLPESWSPTRLRLAAQDRGLSLVTADAFAVGPSHPNGVRISLGGPSKRAVLAEALSAVASLAGDAPTASRLVV